MRERPHNIDRAEWERRFARQIEARAELAGSTLADVVKAELESWPVDEKREDNWRVNTPEDAADEQMSNWIDDGDA